MVAAVILASDKSEWWQKILSFCPSRRKEEIPRFQIRRTSRLPSESEHSKSASMLQIHTNLRLTSRFVGSKRRRVRSLRTRNWIRTVRNAARCFNLGRHVFALVSQLPDVLYQRQVAMGCYRNYPPSRRYVSTTFKCQPCYLQNPIVRGRVQRGWAALRPHTYISATLQK